LGMRWKDYFGMIFLFGTLILPFQAFLHVLIALFSSFPYINQSDA